jgi:TnpA family transposase
MVGSSRTRFQFIKQLAKALVLPQIIRRHNNPSIQRQLKDTMARVAAIAREEAPPNIFTKLTKRVRCALCPYARDSKTSFLCINCKKPVCSE